MPRVARRDIKTTFFHVIVQGISREYIFREEEDIKTYLYLIKKYCDVHNIRIVAYCIMNNHAHFLMYTEQTIMLSKAMQRTNIIYGKYYNKKNERVGYVFRDRFLSEAIKTEKQLLNCIVYIHSNPIKANIVSEIDKYKYSSYNDYIKGQGIATKDTIKLIFGTVKGYIEQFKEIHITHKDQEFMEAFINIENKNNKIIDDYLTRNEITIEEIKGNKEELKKFLLEVRDKRGVSNRKVAQILQIGREKLRKI